MATATRRPREGHRVRFAVVGLGDIAQEAVLPAFDNVRETCELAALVSGSDDKRAELAAAYGVEHTGTYGKLEDVLHRARIDAVYIATPNTTHRELTERAARAHVHVLCEKPLAMTSADCEAMIRACEQAGVHLMVAYRLHFEKGNLYTAELVRSGTIGEPRVFSSLFSQVVRPGDIRTSAETGGGALFDLGVYCINAARALFRDEPVEVVGFDECEPEERGGDVDVTTSALLRFPAGRLATFGVTQAGAPVSSLRIVGTKGSLMLEPAYEYTTDIEAIITVDGESELRVFPRRDQFGPELEAFARCIVEGRAPEPGGREGLADVRIMEAVKESARTGRAVKLHEFEIAHYPTIDQERSMKPVEPRVVVEARPPSE